MDMGINLRFEASLVAYWLQHYILLTWDDTLSLMEWMTHGRRGDPLGLEPRSCSARQFYMGSLSGPSV